VLRFALKRIAQDPKHPVSRDAAWREAIERCLGEEALNLDELARRKARTLGGAHSPMGLGDFFHDPEDSLHPDLDDEDDDDFSDDDEDDQT
jgi:hypothetical protein